MAKKNQGIEIPSFLNMDKQPPKVKKTYNSKKKTKKKVKKRKNKFFRIILGFVIIIGIISLLFLSPLFNIYRINVKNNIRFSSDEIKNIVQIPIGLNMFKIKLSDYKEILENESYIEEAKITRELPDTINIEITEREPYLQIEFVGAYVYIDYKGYILEVSNEKADLKILDGLSTALDQFVPGNRLNEADLKKLNIVNDIINKAKNNEILDSIYSIDVSNSKNYVLTVENGDKLIYIGDDSEMNLKMIWIKNLLKDNAGEQGSIYLDKNLDGKLDEKPIFEIKI